jgi:hypothetical protein
LEHRSEFYRELGWRVEAKRGVSQRNPGAMLHHPLPLHLSATICWYVYACPVQYAQYVTGLPLWGSVALRPCAQDPPVVDRRKPRAPVLQLTHRSRRLNSKANFRGTPRPQSAGCCAHGRPPPSWGCPAPRVLSASKGSRTRARVSGGGGACVVFEFLSTGLDSPKYALSP